MTETNLDRYGHDALPWSRALAGLESPPPGNVTYWLACTGTDGRPHLAGVGAMWVDGTLYFTSGAGTRKSRNLAANPACAISVSLPGIDLTLKGEVTHVTDPATVANLAKRYADSGWPASVGEGGLTAPYSAPSAGPPPWQLYALTLRSAVGVASAEPFGATRWRFD